MKYIIIFYESIPREYNMCCRLKKAIEEKGDYKVHVLSVYFEWVRGLAIALKHEVSLLIVPWGYYSRDYYFFDPFVKLNKDVVIVNLHHEQVTCPLNDLNLLPRTEETKNSMLHFCWGENFASMLRKAGVHKENIFVVGYPRFEAKEDISYSKEMLASRFQLDENKRWILLIESRDWTLSEYTVKQYKKSAIDEWGWTKNEFEGFYEIERASLMKTIDEISRMPDVFFEQNELIFRCHPGVDISYLIDKRAKAVSDLSIYEWLYNIDVSISWQSTAMFESDAAGTATLRYEIEECSSRFLYHGVSEYPKINSLSDLSYINLADVREYEGKERIFQSYLGNVKNDVINEMAQKCISLLTSPPANYRPVYTGKHWKNSAHFFVFDIITRLFDKLGVLELVKYPHYAYKKIREIPYRKGNI